MSGKSPKIRFEAARRFLADHALPLWSGLGRYPNGCFVECLDLSGRPVDPGWTRTRVQARQIYVYSHAAFAGFESDETLAAASVDFFLRACWLGPERGWARLVDRHGGLVDGMSDLYDIGFALLALAWRHRVAPEPRLVAIAHATLDDLDRRMAHPAGGFLNDAAGSLPRLQNPHMHLAEAMNAWFETTGEARFADLGGTVVGLMRRHFCEAGTGALGEYFDEGWRPVPGPQGRIVEPGHLFEWAWIIAHHGRLTGRHDLALVRRLIGFATRTGFDARTGLTLDQVDRDGRVVAGGHRLWPQTEALKAWLAAAEFLGECDPARIAGIVSAILDRYLAPGPLPGTWLDHFDARGRLIAEKVPATSLYHVALAFLELLRLRPAIEAAVPVPPRPRARTALEPA